MNLEGIKKYLRYEKGNLIWKIKRGNKAYKNTVAGSIKPNGYILIKYKGQTLRAHRIVWYFHHNIWSKNQIDHINGIKHDNRIENLREVNNRENQSNRKTHRNGKLIGASKRGQKWISTIGLNKKQIYLGTFETELAAHLAYKNKLEELTEKGVI